MHAFKEPGKLEELNFSGDECRCISHTWTQCETINKKIKIKNPTKTTETQRTQNDPSKILMLLGTLAFKAGSLLYKNKEISHSTTSAGQYVGSGGIYQQLLNIFY